MEAALDWLSWPMSISGHLHADDDDDDDFFNLKNPLVHDLRIGARSFPDHRCIKPKSKIFYSLKLERYL